MSGEGRTEITPEQVRALRMGHGANCSSIGSVVDTLFIGALLGGALFAAVAAALATEPVRVVGQEREEDAERKTDQSHDDATGAP